MVTEFTEANGWMPGVEHIETEDKGYQGLTPGEMYPLLVVNHVMQGYLDTMVRWTKDGVQQGSAQFGVGRDGRIVQFASIWDATWHAGIVNGATNGIVIEKGGNPNWYSIGIEWEGFSIDPVAYPYDYIYGAGTDAKGKARRPWPEAQIRAALSIHDWFFYICQNFAQPSIRTIATHSEIDARSRAQDPGDYWIETVRPRILEHFAGKQPDPKGPDIETAIQHMNAGIAALRG